MILDFKNKLVFISTSKTASTSVESVLRPLEHCGHLGGKKLKHLSFTQFLEIRFGLGVGPEWQTFAIARHPAEKAVSWYNYRRRLSPKKTPRSTRNMSYQEFIRNLTKRDLISMDDSLKVTNKLGEQVDFLFNFSKMNYVENFLFETYGIAKLPIKNSSDRHASKYLLSVEDRLLTEEILERQIENFNKLQFSVFESKR